MNTTTAAPVAVLPLEDALKLYRAPFRNECGYIWDADGHVVCDDDSEHTGAAVRIRGWGRIQYKANPEGLHDAMGELVAQALTEFWNRRAAPHTCPQCAFKDRTNAALQACIQGEAQLRSDLETALDVLAALKNLPEVAFVLAQAEKRQATQTGHQPAIRKPEFMPDPAVWPIERKP